jgi:hypothetical protein
MKALITKTVEVETIRISVPVRYEEEDIPYDYFGRNKDMWEIEFNVNNGQIVGFAGDSISIHMKVVDCFQCQIKDVDGSTVKEYGPDYVPEFMPGEHYGDYVILDINEKGVIVNWANENREDLLHFLEK